MGCVQSEWNDGDKHEIWDLGAGEGDMVCLEIWSIRNQTLNINNQLVLKTNNIDLKLFMDQGRF